MFSYVYDGSSEDSEEMMMNVRNLVVTPPPKSTNPPPNASTAGTSNTNDFDEPNLDKLKVGEIVSDSVQFTSWQGVKKYPYLFIGKANQQLVAERFFDQGKLYNRTWDFFYLHRGPKDSSNQAIILVTTKQFLQFLGVINSTLNTRLTLPAGAREAFRVDFEDDGNPVPRYLGRSSNKEMADRIRESLPNPNFKLPGEYTISVEPPDRSLKAFQTKINALSMAQKAKKTASKEKQKVERFAKQRSWSHSLKRVQRYLGVRLAKDAKKGASPTYQPDQAVPFVFEDSVVFLSVDVEAWERNFKVITEIGVATLDTADLASVAPGEQGKNWRALIRARHFRINENKHHNNHQFVDGCADRFEFGQSEFINLSDAPNVIASCFKHPFSKLDENAPVGGDMPKRNIILVGHDVVGDINFLRSVGYDIYNLSNLQEIVDTTHLRQYVKRESSPRNLGTVLAELGIAGWHLHNAGNDAVYTLQAMVGLALKHLEQKSKLKEVCEEKKNRIDQSIQEATENAWEREQGWSSGIESDGGMPIVPLAPSNSGVKKGGPSAPQQNVTSSPWRNNPQNTNTRQQPQNSRWATHLLQTANDFSKPVGTIKSEVTSLGAQPSVSRRSGGFSATAEPSKPQAPQKVDQGMSGSGWGGTQGRASAALNEEWGTWGDIEVVDDTEIPPHLRLRRPQRW